MDIDGETDEDVPMLLRKKGKHVKVDEHTDFKKLKWQVAMTCGTVEEFKDAISRERHWPKKDVPLEPPSFKVGPSRPKRNKRNDLHEDQGRQMVCSNYKSVGHSKKGCPPLAQSTHGNPTPQKRQPNIPRKQAKRLNKPREEEATTRSRGGSKGRRGRGRTVRGIPSSSEPHSMTDQGQPIVPNQASVATSSSQPLISLP
ncbi:hypothetical protein Cgig2_011517 [Carnegiea gigantea]|uniref:Uncharacterized protein n=1 Tax=Carnegiea gigantea TaxID=171969 RepID=A0A9Q1GZ25_9CARY|nr:hypothetical protein Cgig2_011517 [Carnegiea gigantea]